MAPKKRLFTVHQTRSVQPSQTMCHEHQILVRHHHRRTAKVHVLVNDECKEDYKSHRVVSVAHYSDAHSEPVDVRRMLSEKDTITGPSQASEWLVSDFLDAKNIFDSKRESGQGHFRLSFVSDISDASGLRGIQNDESDTEEATSDDSRQGYYHTACQLKSSIISALSDGSVLQDHERDERADSLRPTSKAQQASSSFLPIELTTVQNDPGTDHLANAISTAVPSFLPTFSSERSLFSADFTVTGLFLDDASLTPHSVIKNKEQEYKDKNGPRKRRICRDRACNNLFLSANYAVPVSIEEPDDDSIVSICGSHVSPVFATSYRILTEDRRNASRKQMPRRVASNAFVEVVAAIFKKTKLTVVDSHRSDCDLIVGFNEKRSNREYSRVTKGRNSQVFAYDFSAWEKRYK